MFDLAKTLGAPIALRDIGVPEAELHRCADIASRNAYANPREIHGDTIRALLENAWCGRRPK
jgi:maleylacetate reductase